MFRVGGRRGGRGVGRMPCAGAWAASLLLELEAAELFRHGVHPQLHLLLLMLSRFSLSSELERGVRLCFVLTRSRLYLCIIIRLCWNIR